MLYASTASFLPHILEPTLNELVGLNTQDPWQVTTSNESGATSTCPTRRIGMKDIERPDGNLQGGPHVSLSTFDEPKFCNTDTKLWRYWPTSVTNSNPGLVVPNLKEGESTVDPWDVSFHENPPFYRRLCSEPPYKSGMADKFASIPDVYLSDKNFQTPLPDLQMGNPKTSPGSHNTSPIHSHL